MITVANGYSVEFALCVIIAITASLVMIGGLGATFYASYFQSSIMLLIILLFAGKIYFMPSTKYLGMCVYEQSLDDNTRIEIFIIGSPSVVYQAINCLEVLKFNNMERPLGLDSIGGLMFGIINLVGKRLF